MTKKYAIVNECDKPEPRMVTQVVNGEHYYMMRSTKEEAQLKQYDGMNPERPTFLEDFGFEIIEKRDYVQFSLIKESKATYKNGSLRVWQDSQHRSKFTLPKVVLDITRPEGLKQIDNAKWIKEKYGGLDLRVTHPKGGNVDCNLSLRQQYCDRGHIQLLINSSHLYIDYADFFPRYFFSFKEADHHVRVFLKWRLWEYRTYAHTLDIED